MFGKVKTPRTSDELVQNVVAQRGKESRRNVEQENRVEFGDVKELDLGSRCFSRIERLWQFSSLTTLLLNNNDIQKMEGMSRLYNLRILNLSFNAIMKMEGLENLKKLEELNLCNNKIAVLENMDSLEKLVLFNMSNNILKELSQVLYLKKLTHLYTLNLSGNPLSEEENYELFIMAFFPNLTYLDYKYVNKDIKERASVEFQIKLQELYDENVAKETKTKELKSQEEELQLHLDAFVESLNGSFLFERMFKDDPLSDKLKSVPEIEAQYKSLEENITGLCVHLFEAGLVEHERRRAEVESFYTCHRNTIAHIIQKETEVLGEFEKYFKEMKQESTLQTVQGKDELNKLQKDFLTLEFKLISQIERMIKKLDAALSEMLSNFCKTAQEIFLQCQKLEDEHHEKMQELVSATSLSSLDVTRDLSDDVKMKLEDKHHDKMQELVSATIEDETRDLSDDVKMIFLDKETLIKELATANKNHSTTLRERESHLMSRTNVWRSRLIKKLQESELQRNRMTLSHITTYVNHYEEEMHKLYNR